jgi:hypothetical protein
MLALAALLLPGVIGEVRQWDALAEPLRFFDLAFLAAAAVLALAGACLLVPIRRWRAALLAGSAAGLVLGAGLIVGTLLGVIPCAGPS